MKEVALLHEKIIKKISLYENGAVADTMNNLGLKYEINYGLSKPQIDMVSDAIIKSNTLAFYLWQQKEREAKLISLRVIEDYQLTKEQIEKYIAGINNVELAEQAAMLVFSKLDTSMKLAHDLIGRKNFIKLS